MDSAQPFRTRKEELEQAQLSIQLAVYEYYQPSKKIKVETDWSEYWSKRKNREYVDVNLLSNKK